MNFVHYLDTNILNIKEEQATRAESKMKTLWQWLMGTVD